MTEQFWPLIRYLGDGIFEKITDHDRLTIPCKCSILYRPVPYSLTEYEAGVMHMEYLNRDSK
jgi:hypothetical protein